MDPVRTRKYRNVRDGNTKVAFVVDDLASVNPWIPRYLRIYGEAELVERDGQFGPAAYLRITPVVSWSFNLEGRPFSHDVKVTTTRTVHTPEAVTNR
jgi:pyridoxamine 5'-phosphate oxidase family protein